MTMADALVVAEWQKSTRTGQGGADCVEVAVITAPALENLG